MDISEIDIASKSALDEIFDMPKQPEKVGLKTIIRLLSESILSLSTLNQRLSSSAVFPEGIANADAYKEQLDGDALRVAEHKQVYTLVKKELAQAIKAFNRTYLTEDVENASDIDVSASIKEDAKALIQKFKNGFDAAIAAAKFSETCFIGTYKYIRSSEDPCPFLSTHILYLKTLHEQLSTLASSSRSDGVSSETEKVSVNAHTPSNYEKQILELEGEIEQSNQKVSMMQGQLMEQKASIEGRLKDEETRLRATFDQKMFTMQQHYEHMLDEKALEIDSLLASVHELTQKYNIVQEKEALLEKDFTKRKERELKYAASQDRILELEEQMKEVVSKDVVVSQLRQALEHEQQMNRQGEATHQDEIQKLKHRVSYLEDELSRRPPMNLSELFSRLGIFFDVDKPNTEAAIMRQASSSTPGVRLDSPREYISWSEIETAVVEHVRKVNSEAIHARGRELEVSKKLEWLEQEVSALTHRVDEKDDLIAVLQDELRRSSIHDQQHQPATSGMSRDGEGSSRKFKALIRPQTSSSGITSYSTGAEHSFLASLASVNLHLNVSDTSVEPAGTNPNDELSALFDPFSQSTPQPPSDAPESPSSTLSLFLQPSATPNTNAATSSASTSISRPLNHMTSYEKFYAVLKKKDEEIDAFRKRYESLENEFRQLQTENMELFRRLRSLRMTTIQASGTGSGSSDKGYDSLAYTDASSTTAHMRKSSNTNKSWTDWTDGAFAHGTGDVESKYLKYHEDRIDPFNLEDIDRQAAVSKLPAMDRWLVVFLRLMMQDRWTRGAWIFYMAFIHLLALGYVVKVLNPQMIDELDMHLMKQQWSSETMQAAMDREHPDLTQ